MHFHPIGALSLVSLGLTVACSSPHPPTEVKRMIAEATAAAAIHLAEGEPHEASELTRAVQAVDPDYAPAADVRASLPSDLDEIYRSRLLGSNLAKRIPTERSMTAKVLLYPVDRFLDLLDVISIDLHVGAGMFLNYHATRAMQAGIGLRAVSGLGWHERRSLGSKSQADSGITLGPFGAEVSAATILGTSGLYSSADSITGMHRPASPAYQEYRDYWAVGVGVTLIYIGYDVDFHPVQLADFFAGWATIDFLNDDFARTRGMNLSRAERRWMTNLYKLEREPKILSAYRELLETEAEEARLAEEAAAAEAERADAEAAAAAEAEAAQAESASQRLRELQESHEEGLITDEEYQSLKRDLIDGL